MRPSEIKPPLSQKRQKKYRLIKIDLYSYQTVPLWALLFGLSVPLITIIFMEKMVLPLLHSRKSTHVLSGKHFESEAIKLIVGYMFGTCASYSFTIIAKFTIGRLRPHFLDVCNPNFQDIDCGTDAHPLFVTDYVCQGKLGFKETFVSTYLLTYLLSICFFWSFFCPYITDLNHLLL